MTTHLRALALVLLTMLAGLTVPAEALADLTPPDYHLWTPQQKYLAARAKWERWCAWRQSQGQPCDPPPTLAQFQDAPPVTAPVRPQGAGCDGSPARRDQAAGWLAGALMLALAVVSSRMPKTGRAAARGMNLLEAMVVTAIVGILGLVVSGACLRLMSVGNGGAEADARAFGAQLGLRVVGVSCMNADTDADGYISCSLAHESKDGQRQVMAVECARRLSWASGCRIPKAVVRGTR